jgi:hypothetical protein
MADTETTEKEAPSVNKTANDYMVPMTESARENWKGKEEAFVKHAQEVASGLYPTLAPQIAQGVTTKTLIEPYEHLAKQTLGEDVEPNWADPKWSKILEGGIDKQTGRATLMPLSAARQYMQTEPGFGFENSTAALHQADQFSNALNEAFGGR